jgi:hypothetical protein
MPWWIPELVRVAVLGGCAVLVQRLIRRHGVAYAEEVFRETPRAGAAFLALADIAYYLIVVAYIAFTLQLERHGVATRAQAQSVVETIGGLALIVGGLHAFNVFVLPAVGRGLAPRPRRPTFPKGSRPAQP